MVLSHRLGLVGGGYLSPLAIGPLGLHSCGGYDVRAFSELGVVFLCSSSAWSLTQRLWSMAPRLLAWSVAGARLDRRHRRRGLALVASRGWR